MEEKSRDPKTEWLKCSIDPAYFISEYCRIYNATERVWLPFNLWPAQMRTLEEIDANRMLVILKARQLGLSWLTLCYILWHMLFHPAATALIFSKRDDEAVDLLDIRLKGVYDRLPAWLQVKFVETDNDHEWRLSNGSAAMCFPTTGGRSYTGSIVLIDEADFVQDLDGLLNAVQPTIDAGGKMIMISTVDKSRPMSPFKRIYNAAKEKLTDWFSVFLPWHSRPGRDAAWYAAREADALHRTGSLDDMHQEYPATDAEALAPRTLDKRLPATWLNHCYVAMQPLAHAPGAPAIPGLRIYRLPVAGHRYVLGCDPAEGNPNSDDSALTVLDIDTGEEVASLAGKIEMSVMGNYANLLGVYYNRAAVMVERNNHGHTVLQWLGQNGQIRRLLGNDKKRGWLSSSLGKATLYNLTAEAFKEGETTLHSFSTFNQLASIEGETLRAPEGQMDDLADSYALALAGRWRIMRRDDEPEAPRSISF